MSDEMTPLFERLDLLLEREREILLSGRLGDLPALAEEKEELLARLSGLDAQDRDGLGALQGKAVRNQELLDTALRGIRAVANRVNAARRLHRQIETYDRHGQRTVVVLPDSTVEKRA